MEDLHKIDPRYQEKYLRLPELAILRDALAPLSMQHRLAFAVCCCERLYPDYKSLVAHLQTPDVLRPLLDRLWDHVRGSDMSEDEISRGLESCRSLPLGEDDGSESVRNAIDSAGAVSITLNACVIHPLDNVVSTAQLCRNRVDRPLWKRMAQRYNGMVKPEDHDQIQDAIRSDPTMIAEIERESAQLRYLYECEELTENSIAQLLSL